MSYCTTNNEGLHVNKHTGQHRRRFSCSPQGNCPEMRQQRILGCPTTCPALSSMFCPALSSMLCPVLFNLGHGLGGMHKTSIALIADASASSIGQRPRQIQQRSLGYSSILQSLIVDSIIHCSDSAPSNFRPSVLTQRDHWSEVISRLMVRPSSKLKEQVTYRFSILLTPTRTKSIK